MDNSVVKIYYKYKQDFTIASYYHVNMNNDAKNLSENLRKLMEHHQDTQVTLAKKSGVSQKTISNMLNADETKSPNLTSVGKIAAAYNLQMWHLLIPSAPLDILSNKTIEKLVDNYINANPDARDAVSRIVEVTTQYKRTA